MPNGRVGVPEESPEDAAQLQWRPKHFGDASTMGCLPRTAAAVERSQPEPSVCGWQSQRSANDKALGDQRTVWDPTH